MKIMIESFFVHREQMKFILFFKIHFLKIDKQLILIETLQNKVI